MKRERFTEEQIAFALRQADAGTPVAEVCRKLNITEQTFYRWKKKYRGMGVAELRRLKQLEQENRKLKTTKATEILKQLSGYDCEIWRHPGSVTATAKGHHIEKSTKSNTSKRSEDSSGDEKLKEVTPPEHFSKTSDTSLCVSSVSPCDSLAAGLPASGRTTSLT